MKKIAYVVALGLAAVSAHADDKPGQPLFSIASDALPAVEKQTVSETANTLKVQKAPAKAESAKVAKAESAKAAEKAVPAAPLFNVSSDALAATEAPVAEKLVVTKKTVAKQETAAVKAPAAEKAAVEKPLAKVEANADVTVEAKADTRATITLQPKSEPALAKAEDTDKAPAETALFKVASYYEADEMGDSDDAVRKIDFSKPQGEQLPTDGKKVAAKAEKAAKAEAKVVAERAINSNKAIQLAATPAKPKKQKGSYSYVVRGKRYQTLASSENFVEEGPASWYGPGFHGRKTASGEIYDMHMLTAAHKELPLGTKLEVTNKRTGKTVVVTVNDRGPFHGNRILDLSHAAAKQLGLVHAGVGEVTIRAIK